MTEISLNAMSISTLLVDNGPIPQKRKADSLLEESSQRNAPSTFSSFTNIRATQTTDSQHMNPSPGAPCNKTLKKVKFTLDRRVSFSARRSFEVNVSPTDQPSAITSTVKDYFGLHNCGVSFTDCDGAILIVSPDNLVDGMEVIVSQTDVPFDEESNLKKKRKSTLSSRKKTRRVTTEEEVVDEEEEVEETIEETKVSPWLPAADASEKKSFSADVSIDNILDSSRRRPSKFSSDVSLFCRASANSRFFRFLSPRQLNPSIPSSHQNHLL